MEECTAFESESVVTVNPETRVIQITGPIEAMTVHHFLLGINACMEKKEDGRGTVHLIINSTGGSPDAMFGIVDIINAVYKYCPIWTYGIGEVQSAAVGVFISGARRIAAPNCSFMIHPLTAQSDVGLGGAPVSPELMHATVRAMKNKQHDMIKLYYSKMRESVRGYFDLNCVKTMLSETNYFGTEAMKYYGWIDSILNALEMQSLLPNSGQREWCGFLDDNDSPKGTVAE